MIEKLQNGQAFSGLFLHIVILLAFSVLFALVAAYRFGRNNDTRQFV
jgi:ABC-2 type transport system permease protein